MDIARRDDDRRPADAGADAARFPGSARADRRQRAAEPATGVRTAGRWRHAGGGAGGRRSAGRGGVAGSGADGAVGAGSGARRLGDAAPAAAGRGAGAVGHRARSAGGGRPGADRHRRAAPFRCRCRRAEHGLPAGGQSGPRPGCAASLCRSRRRVSGDRDRRRGPHAGRRRVRRRRWRGAGWGAGCPGAGTSGGSGGGAGTRVGGAGGCRRPCRAGAGRGVPGRAVAGVRGARRGDRRCRDGLSLRGSHGCAVARRDRVGPDVAAGVEESHAGRNGALPGPFLCRDDRADVSG